VAPIVSHRLLWVPALLTPPQWLRLVEATQAMAVRLRQPGDAGWAPPLQGCHVALLRPHNTGLQTQEFEHAVQALGARLALLDSTAWLREAQGHPDGLADAAHMLGRLYNLVDCCHMQAGTVTAIDNAAGVPVLNGLAVDSHPIYVVADLMAAREASGLAFDRLRLCLLGDASTPVHQTARAAAEALGMELAAQAAQTVGAAPDADEPSCDFALDTRRQALRGRLQTANGSPLETRGLAQAAAHYRRSLTQALLLGLLR
jgi:ornithine carbamoyltransferase